MYVWGFIGGCFVGVLPNIAYLSMLITTRKAAGEEERRYNLVPRNRYEFLLSLSQITGLTYVIANIVVLLLNTRFSYDFWGYIGGMTFIFGPLLIIFIGMLFFAHRYPL